MSIMHFQECLRKKEELEERERKMKAEIAEMEKQKKKCSRDIEVCLWGGCAHITYVVPSLFLAAP